MILAKIKRFRCFFARHRFLLFVEAVLVWLIFVAAIIYAIGFFMIPSVVESKIQKRCGGAVDIQFVRFKGLGAIRLNGVVVARDDPSILKDPILKADQVEMQFDLRALLRGRFSVHTVVLSDFLLTADYNTSSKTWNLGGLSFQKPNTSGGQIPLLQIQRGTIRFRQTNDDGQEILARVGIKGRIAAPVDKNEYSFTLETDGRFGFGKSVLQGGFQVGNRGEQNHVFAEGQISLPKAGILQNQWDMKDIRLLAEFDDKVIAIKEFGFSMGQGQIQMDGRIHRDGNYPIKLNMGLHGLTLADRHVPDTLSYGWLIEASDSGLARFLKQFRPVGTGELDLSITGDLKELSRAEVNGTIVCKNISVCYERFPYRIEEMQGNIEFQGRVIQLQQLQARHGDVQLQLDGEVINTRPQMTIDICLTSENMRFDEDLYQSLPENIKKTWYDFTPQGQFAVEYCYQQETDGTEEKTLTLEFNKDASAIHKYFRYPLKNLTGKIVLKPGELHIKDVLANDEHAGHIKIFGRIIQHEDAEQVFDVHIQGRKIPLEPTLFQALPKKYDTFFRNIEDDKINGLTNFDVSVFPDKNDERFLDYSAQINVTADAFQYHQFPLLMTEPNLVVTVNQDTVLLNSFYAQSKSGPIRIEQGRLWSQGADPNQPGICLTLDLNNFDLDDMFWDSVGLQLRDKLDQFSLRGPIRAEGQLAINAPQAAASGIDLVVDCNDNALVWGDSVFGKVGGRVHIKDDRALFTDFEVSNLSLELVPKEFVPEKTERLFTQIDPQGTIDIYIKDGFFETARQKPKRADLYAEIRSRGLSLGEAEVVSGLKGYCGGHFAVDFETNDWQTTAHYHISQFMYRNRPVTDLIGDLVFDPNAMQLKSDGFVAKVCGGDATGNLRIHFQPNESPRYQMELTYHDVDVQQFMAAEGEEASRQISRGLAAGRFVLEGRLDDFSTSRGTFETKIADLKMGQQSLLGKVLTAVQLRQPQNFVFTEIDLSAAVLGPELVFNHLRMVGSPLVFYGQGKLNLQDRQIEMELASWNQSQGSEETILETLARGIGSALWKIQVRGTLDEPKVDAVYLSILKQPLNLFKGSN